MKEPYNVSTPIELFFQQIQECINFVSAAPILITVEQIIDSAFLTLQRTGVFNTECCKWRKRPNINNTWDNFHTFFREVQSDYLEDQDMTEQQGSQF